MQFCSCEGRDFPNAQFKPAGGVLMHFPPGGDPHPVRRGHRPPPDAIRMMTAADLLSDPGYIFRAEPRRGEGKDDGRSEGGGEDEQ